MTAAAAAGAEAAGAGGVAAPVVAADAGGVAAAAVGGFTAGGDGEGVGATPTDGGGADGAVVTDGDEADDAAGDAAAGGDALAAFDCGRVADTSTLARGDGVVVVTPAASRAGSCESGRGMRGGAAAGVPTEARDSGTARGSGARAWGTAGR